MAGILLLSVASRSETRPFRGEQASAERTAETARPDDPMPVTFSDVTESAGIDFVHVRGASGKKYVVETLGSGAAFFDYDQDGLLDIYLVNGAALPGYDAPTPPTNILYRNLGDGRFTDVTEEAGVGDTGYGMGSAVADYDNDGFPDLYVTNFGPDAFYRNNADGTFTNITAGAGLGCELWGASAGFGDIDGDSDLDLYVVNYLDFGLDNNKECDDPATGLRDYCHPDVYNGLPDVMYRNNGDGTFSDVTTRAGVYTTEGKGLGVVIGDYDDDGDADIYVANDSVRNFLWRNSGDGRFEDVALLAGVAFNEAGVAEAGMGVDFGDFDNDRYLDIFLTHLDLETNTLYRNLGTGLFIDATFVTGMAKPSLFHVGFGTGFVDYDNDGDLDVFIANGHILESVDQRKASVSYKQPSFLMRNNGNGVFENVGPSSGEHFSERRSSRGTAFGDYDNDGDVDVLVMNSGEVVNLLRNEGGNRRHKLVVELTGTTSNRDGIGARLVLGAGGKKQLREVHGAYSYCSHNDLRVPFGLEDSPAAEWLEIRWPSGRVERLADLAANQWLIIKEGVGVISARPFGQPPALGSAGPDRNRPDRD